MGYLCVSGSVYSKNNQNIDFELCTNIDDITWEKVVDTLPSVFEMLPPNVERFTFDYSDSWYRAYNNLFTDKSGNYHCNAITRPSNGQYSALAGLASHLDPVVIKFDDNRIALCMSSQLLSGHSYNIGRF